MRDSSLYVKDKLIHSYFGVDTHLVWQTIKNRLPGFREILMEELI